MKIMKNLVLFKKITLFLGLVLFTLFSLTARSRSYDELKDNIAYVGEHVRFTVVTAGSIRMEWSKNGKFVDEPSFVAVNRKYPAVNFHVKEKKKYVEITTSKIKLHYVKDGKKFSEANLKISSLEGIAPAFVWKPGMQQKENLKGTFRTLDGMSGSKRGDEEIEYPDGLLAKDGWTLINDTNNFLFDDSPWPWVKKRSESVGNDECDWYFIGYGHDYKAALKDFTVFAGRIPMPPKYAFGYWWSRYWAYSDNELRTLVKNFHNYGVPLDVLVVDMDWHYTEKGKGGWTGWTWNKKLFPNHAKFLRWLKKQNLMITLNLHPADGIAYYESQYPKIAKAMGIDPNSKKTIEWLASDKRFMNAMFSHILHPMQNEGVDFWWLDWQQWLNDKQVEGLNNTWWINYCFFTDMERNAKVRPMLYHRWGGLGNHRYQIGFSGDSHINWASLDFQINFNSTASNVLYGYWSHDIGGHMCGTVYPELYTRWMQFGSVAPVMRTHSSKDPEIVKEPWNFGRKDCEILINTIKERYEMVPYIYTMARQAYESGVSLCRPMYYDYPDDERSYFYKNEYMFGDNMLIHPITMPMNGVDCTAENELATKGEKYSIQKVWLPEGKSWYEWRTGTLLKGGQEVERKFAIDEYPIYIKEGSILPLYVKDEIKNLKGHDEPIVIDIFPGKEGNFKMYEDNGNDNNYAKEFAVTPLSFVREDNILNAVISSRVGEYKDMPSHRNFTLKVEASAIPTNVYVNEDEVEFEYDGNTLSLYIAIPETDCSIEKRIRIVYPEYVNSEPTITLPSGERVSIASGLVAKFDHVQKAVLSLKQRVDHWPGIIINDELGFLESAGMIITYDHDRFLEVISKYDKLFLELPAILRKQGLDEENQHLFLKEI